LKKHFHHLSSTLQIAKLLKQTQEISVLSLHPPHENKHNSISERRKEREKEINDILLSLT